jgi:hypothetical protein
MRVDQKKRQDAGIELMEIAELYKQYRPEMTDKMGLKLAILGNPDLGELYSPARELCRSEPGTRRQNLSGEQLDILRNDWA